MDVPVSGRGVLAVTVQEFGISATARLSGGAPAGSPVERRGVIYLAGRSDRVGVTRLSVSSRDAPAIGGKVCVAAELIPPEAPLRTQAALAAAAGAQAVERTAWQQAFDAYQRAARSFDALRMPAAAAAVRHALADLAYRRFDPRDGYALAGMAISGFLKAGQEGDSGRLGLLSVLQAKALLDSRAAGAQTVAADVQRRLGLARRQLASDPASDRELPRIDILEGFLRFLLNDVPAARHRFEQAAARCGAMSDWECYAIASQNLAQLAEEDSNFPRALAIYADVLTRLPPELDPKLAAEIWTNLARLQRVTGLVGSSRHSSAQAMQIYAGIGNCEGMRLSLVRSGQLLVQVGTLADAGHELQAAASASCESLLASRSASHPGVVLPAPGTDSSQEGSFRDRPCSEALSPLGLQAESRSVVFSALLALSDILRMQERPAEAQRCLAAASAFVVDFRTRIGLANALGEVLLVEGNAQGARDAFETSLRVADEARLPALQEQRAAAQLGLARALLAAREPRQAVLWALKSLHSCMARGDIAHAIRALYVLGRSYREEGDPDAALRTLRVAADLVDAIPIAGLDGELRASFLATQHAVFSELTDLYASRAAADPAQAWLAFEAADRGTARSLHYALSQAGEEASGEGPGADLARYAHLSERMVQIGSGTQELCSLGACVAPLEKIASQPMPSSERLDRTRLRTTLQALGSSLLEYAVGSRDLYAFLVRDGELRVTRLAPLAQVESAAAELREQVRDPDAPAQAVRAASAKLASLILWPVSGQLGTRGLLVVAADVVHTVPLALLPFSASAPDDLLVARVATSAIPSAQWLTDVHAPGSTRAGAARLALVGDPVFRPSDWQRECVDRAASALIGAPAAARSVLSWAERLPRLPGSRLEVDDIARLADATRPHSHIESLVGCAATPAALRNALGSRVDLLHLATHARLDSERPRLSAFALTPESGRGPDSGEFSLLDVLGLHLTGGIVVLSACDTSSGRLLPGEGVLGPAQGFLQAGAAAVVGSYWRVDDRATTQFMHVFYRHLLVRGSSVPAALQAAQLERAAVSPPRDWAAFAAYGWPEARL